MSQASLTYDQPFKSVVIFGPPGAGKGTVSKALALAGSMCHLSTGDIFRGLSPHSPAGTLSKSYADKGQLVPDDVTIQIWRNYTDGLVATNRYLPEEQYLLLDGIPRTLPQVELITPHIEVHKVLVLDVPEEELIRRLTKRGKASGRTDDSKEEILRKRLDVYQVQTAEVLTAYPDEKIVHFNGDQTPMKVLGDILSTIGDELTLSKDPLNVG